MLDEKNYWDQGIPRLAPPPKDDADLMDDPVIMDRCRQQQYLQQQNVAPRSGGNKTE